MRFSVVPLWPLIATIVLLPSPTASAQTVGPSAIRLGGYVQFDFLAPRADASQSHTFRVRRARLQAAGDLDDHVDWSVSVEASTTPVLRDAVLRLRYWPAMTVRLGQMVMPYGQEQYQFSSNTLPFTERVTGEIIASRDAGLVVSNERPFLGWLSYAAAIVNGTGQNTSDNNSAKDVMLRISATPAALPGLRVAVNGMRGKQPDGRRDRFGADVSFERRSMHAAAEVDWQQTDHQPSRRVAYLFAAWRLHPRTPHPGFDHAELGVRVTHARSAAAASAQWDLAASYYVRHNLRFMGDVVLRRDPAPGAAATLLQVRANVRF